MSGSASSVKRRSSAGWGWPILGRPLGLQARIALLVSSSLLALIALFVVLGLSILRESTERGMQDRSLLAEAVADHLDLLIDQASSGMEVTARAVAPSLAAGDEAAFDAQLVTGARALAPVASGLLLFDPNGALLRSEPDPLPGLHATLNPRVMGDLASGKGRGVDWIRTPTGLIVLPVVAVGGQPGEVQGYLAAAIDLSSPTMGQWLRHFSSGPGGRVDVVDGGGAVLTSSEVEAAVPAAEHGSYFSALMAEGQPRVATCFDCHASSTEGPARSSDIMVFAPLRSAPLGVVLRQPEGELMAPSRQFQLRLLGLGALALLVSLLMVLITTRGVVRPIRSLIASTRAIAEGKLGEPVVIQGSDEIAELARSLDDMRRRLQRSMEDIRGCNTMLDHCVRERTRELEQSRSELEQSRDYLQSLIDRLSILNSIGVTLNRSLDLGTTLSGALADTLKLMGMQAGAIYLVDERSGELELAAHHGLSLEAARVAANLGLSASLCAAAAQADEPLVVEDTTRYAKGSRSVLRTENMRCMVRVPFKSSSGQLLGTMCLGTSVSRSFSKAEVDLLVSVSNQVAAAAQNARLYEEIRQKGQMRGELLVKVIAAQEAERKRIARELHDQTSQALAALAVAVETAAAQAEAGEDVSGSLARMKALAVDTLEEVHRMIFDLRPTLLDDLGLIAALRWYVETRLGEVGIRVRLEVGGEERRLAPQIETALYRVVQEAINNVVNHSGAQSCTITLVLRADSLSLTIMDDGWGFDMAELARSGDPKRGLGLMGMKERIELLRGTFAVYSGLGSGTRITVEVPLVEGGDQVGREDPSIVGG